MEIKFNPAALSHSCVHPTIIYNTSTATATREGAELASNCKNKQQCVYETKTRTDWQVKHGTIPYTPCSKKVLHQAHIDNLVNSQRIFKILSLTHSAENLL